MKPFNKSVLEILHKRGAMEIRFLVRTVLRSTPLKKSETDVIEKLLPEALSGKTGFIIIEYPKYRLTISPMKLPTSKYARTAVLALKEAKAPLTLPDIVHAYNAKYRHGAVCPEFWMWHTLNAKELSRIISRNGTLCLDLTDSMRKELDGKTTATKVVSQKTPRAIVDRLDEKSLETVLASRPDLLEPGLTVFQRQSRIPIGIIDLLCVDRKRNYVVVEIKRPSADYREVVGQITAYIGWLRKNVATKGQTVRGIIVIGKQNERLGYSLDLIPDISVRTFF